LADFVHLHCHSQYSLRDGVASVEELVCAAKKANMPAMALTDHGNMFGLIPFYRECKKQEINPIIGVEAYVAVFNRFVKTTKIECTHRPLEPGQKFPYERHHLTILAQNETGYRNLVQLVSKSYTEGFYKYPRMDKELLRRHSDGLIGMSACKAGEVGYFLDRENKQGALKAVRKYTEIFDGRFFLELMPHNSYNHSLIEIAKESDAELVVTQDVHYINRDDSDIQKVIGFYGKKKREDLPDYNYDLSFKTREQMEKTYQDFPKDIIQRALDNTVKIANQCNVELSFLETEKKKKSLYPRYHKLKSTEIKTENQEANELLRNLVMEKAKERGVVNNSDIMKQVEDELQVICDANYASYFLAETDILENAGGDEPIFCNARGSAAGSYVAYLLGITQVDPIEHGLMFERFLNPERPKMPDIDIDVEDNRRQDIFDYIVEKYGRDNVARLLSFSTVQPRLALKLAGEYLEIPEAQIDEIYLSMVGELKGLPDEDIISGNIIHESVKSLSGFGEIISKDEQLQNLVNLAKRVEGKLFNVSFHPAGILTSRHPLTDFVPLWMRKDEIAVQLDYNNSGLIGLKYDFLLSKALTVIKDTIRQVEEIHGTKIDIDNLFNNPNDPQVYELISSGQTTTIFQLNSNLAKRVSAQVKPSSLQELVVLNAMPRPAPIKRGKVDEYIRNRDQGIPTHPIKECNPILKETMGVLFLQEQIMKICTDVAGFDLKQTDIMRSLLGKKLSKLDPADIEKLNELKIEFLKGVKTKGYNEELANNLFEELADFSEYCFNKSHCVSYTRLIYVTAYLKLHYPEIYMCSWLNHANVKDNRIEYLNECKRLGIQLLPPDINKSNENFTLEIDGNNITGIRFGLGHIKDVAKRADEIIKERNANGEYESFQDFISRASVIKSEKDARIINSKRIEALVKAGAFDSFSSDRNLLLRYIHHEDIKRRRNNIRKIEKTTKSKLKLSLNLGFCGTDREALIRFISMPLEKYTAKQKTDYEIEYIGVHLPFELLNFIDDSKNYLFLPPIEKILNSPSGTLFKALGFIEEIGPEKRNRYNQMRIPLILSDPTGKLKLNLDKFKYRQILSHIKAGNIVSVLARTRVIRTPNEPFRIFVPERIKILG